MARRPSLDQVAYGAAIADLAKLLGRLGVENPQREAADFMQELVHDGWRHTRPKLDVEPPKGVPASEEVREALIAELRAELAKVEGPPAVEDQAP